jgi:hypothetical protein
MYFEGCKSFGDSRKIVVTVVLGLLVSGLGRSIGIAPPMKIILRLSSI